MSTPSLFRATHPPPQRANLPATPQHGVAPPLPPPVAQGGGLGESESWTVESLFHLTWSDCKLLFGRATRPLRPNEIFARRQIHKSLISTDTTDIFLSEIFAFVYRFLIIYFSTNVLFTSFSTTVLRIYCTSSFIHIIRAVTSGGGHRGQCPAPQ